MTDNVSEAHELVRRREWAAAIQIYDPILCPSTSNFNTPKDRIIGCLVGRSECYLELHEFESVVSDCQRLVKMLSEGQCTIARIHRRLIHSLYKLKWYKEAETACNDWIAVLGADHDITRLIERYRTVIQIANGQQNNPRESVQTRLDNEVTALDDKLESWACTALDSDLYSAITAHMVPKFDSNNHHTGTNTTSVVDSIIAQTLINEINTELVNNETINASTATTTTAAAATSTLSRTVTPTTGPDAMTSMATNVTTSATSESTLTTATATIATTIAAATTATTTDTATVSTGVTTITSTTTTKTNSVAEDDASASESPPDNPLQIKPIELHLDQLTVSSKEDVPVSATPTKATTIPLQRTVSSSSANLSIISNVVTSPSAVLQLRSDTPLSSNASIISANNSSNSSNNNSSQMITCSYCAITLNTRADLRAHCQTESHQNVIMSDEGTFPLLCFK